MLKSTVQIKEGVTALEDNRAALNTGEANKSFAPANINFTWTGVIIGGQPASVDWQFLPPTSSTFDKLVYDNQVTGLVAGTAVPTTAGQTSTPNYTILFDNYTKTGTQNSVRFALELENIGGQDFWGKDNLIRQGAKFYLQGEMRLADGNDTGLVWDANYQVPPLNQTTGVSTQTKRVFIQDHMTIANVKLGPNALKQAVLSVPDLRTSQSSLGLSVDLSWTQGLTFTPVIGQ
jgi:hypothetical protein